MTEQTYIEVPPKSGRALVVKRGDTVRVTDIEGCQVADFVCFNEHDHKEFLSSGKTRMNAWKVRISTGDVLFSNRNRSMFTITADTVGVHDLLFPPCNRWLYQHVLGAPGKTGCLENLSEALKTHGIEEDQVPDPFNLFMNTSVGPDNKLQIHLPESKAGDYIELKAEMDCLIGITSCAEDVSTECNGGRCTPIGVETRC
ncbi:MAG: urea carboxylase-associated family protein [Gammaproteobacteria bacterium]|nr:urea carboxylase-associated family protein [Gammaproteobacteria bacterium]